MKGECTVRPVISPVSVFMYLWRVNNCRGFSWSLAISIFLLERRDTLGLGAAFQ